MNRLEKQFYNASRAVELKKDEKDAIRSRLLSYMQNPIPKPAVPSPYARFVVISQYFKAQYVSVALVILIVGAGVSAAAEHSLPGQPLYQVKTSVNENIQGLFAFTPQSKAQLQTELVSRRLEEVEKLAASGDLNADVQAKLETKLQDHLAAIETNVKRLEGQNKPAEAADAVLEAEVSLKAHSAILDDLAEKDSSLKDVAEAVSIQATAVSLNREAIDAKITNTRFSKKVLEDKQKKAEDAIAVVMPPADDISSMSMMMLATSGEAMVKATTSADIKLAEAEDTLAEAVKKAESGFYGSAYVLFEKAERMAIEAKALMDAEAEIDVTVPPEEPSATSTATSTVKAEAKNI